MFTSASHTIFNPTKKLSINASTPSNSQIATCKLFVGNLATHTTGAHLQAIFHSYGQVIECVKVRERYGFVRFASGDEAQRALVACNGIQLNGYPMIVEYAQNEILISPLSPRTCHPTSAPPATTAAASFRPHPYHAGRSISYQADTKFTTPITINTHTRHQTTHSTRDDIPLLSTATATMEMNKYASSTLNPDASAFTLSFSPSHHYQQIRIHTKPSNTETACSSSDYYSQSGIPSSGSASVRSAASLSPSILSAISPSILLPFDSPTDDQTVKQRVSHSEPKEKRQSTGSALNLFIGDKILSLYGSNGQVDANNNQPALANLNFHGQPCSSVQFDNRDIDPRDPIFIWNFVFFPDVSISPFVKRGDIKGLLERRISLYSR